MKLIEYVKNRGAQSALAAKLSITPVLVSQWANEARPVPPERCVEIEKATDGAVTRKDLRPNDWERIWPELAITPAQRRKDDPPAGPDPAPETEAVPSRRNLLECGGPGQPVTPRTRSK